MRKTHSRRQAEGWQPNPIDAYRSPSGSTFRLNQIVTRELHWPAEGNQERQSPEPAPAQTSTNRKPVRCTAASSSADFPNSAPARSDPIREMTASLRPPHTEVKVTPLV